VNRDGRSQPQPLGVHFELRDLQLVLALGGLVAQFQLRNLKVGLRFAGSNRLIGLQLLALVLDSAILAGSTGGAAGGGASPGIMVSSTPGYFHVL
jgi:hypothetical protein